MNFPQINIGSTGRGFLHISQFIPLPSDTPWGNLYLKSVKIVQRLDYVNQKLPLIYRHCEEMKSQQGFPYDLSALESEEVVYWLRKSADEFVQIVYLGFCLKRDGSYPTRITVDSIGKLLEGRPPDFCNLFAAERAKLSQLNEVSNACKHSFLNSDMNLVGRDKPVVFSLSVAHNDLKHPPKFNAIALSDFIAHFDQLYIFLKNKCAEFFPPKEPNKKGCIAAERSGASNYSIG